MNFYIQACIDLKLNELYYVAKSTSIHKYVMADLPDESFYEDGLETHVPGETSPNIAYEDRHVVNNYLVSGDYDALELGESASCLNGELVLEGGCTIHEKFPALKEGQ